MHVDYAQKKLFLRWPKPLAVSVHDSPTPHGGTLLLGLKLALRAAPCWPKDPHALGGERDAVGAILGGALQADQ